MFDATFIPGGSHIPSLQSNNQIRYWIMESFGHLKSIGATGEATEFVRQTLATVNGLQVATPARPEPIDWYGVVTARAIQKPETFKEGVQISKDAPEFVGRFFYAISQHRNFPRELDGLSTMVAF